jgi:hypothetical protein
MIDEWAGSVKPSADPTVIRKHIEQMVEVRGTSGAFYKVIPLFIVHNYPGTE